MRKTKERKTAMLSMFQENPELSVSDLSKHFNVSQVTIRKDLSELEGNGVLVRSYGKARLRSSAEPTSHPCFIPPDSHSDYPNKQIIGALAAQRVLDEDYIFIGPGYTCLEVAKNLKSKKRLCISTMNISAAIELSDVPEFKLQITPGDFTKRNGTYYVTGVRVCEALENSYFDKIIITVDGISIERGFSVLDEITARIFRTILKHECQVYVCATSSKFGKNAPAPLGKLSLATKIFTDSPISEEFRVYFADNGIDVIQGY